MSASSPTAEEMQDLVTLVLPRVVVQALANPDGEFYSGKIMDEATEKALRLYD